MGLYEILSPDLCIFCRRPAADDFPGVCHRCLGSLPWRTNRFDLNLDIPGASGRKAFGCSDEPYSGKLKAAMAVFDFSGEIRHCLLQLKFYGCTGYAQTLAALIVYYIRHRKLQFDLVMAVPLHPRRYRERGYNQAALLACFTAASLGCPDLSAMLVRNRYTPRQSEQESKDLRYGNLADAFSIVNFAVSGYDPAIIRHRRVLLLDDIITTGATVQAAAKPLVAAGGLVTVLAVASGHQ